MPAFGRGTPAARRDRVRPAAGSLDLDSQTLAADLDHEVDLLTFLHVPVHQTCTGPLGVDDSAEVVRHAGLEEGVVQRLGDGASARVEAGGMGRETGVADVDLRRLDQLARGST
jgi:hypothetical protein